MDEKDKKKNFRIYFNIGVCYEKLGNIEVALIEYEKALKINQNYGQAVLNYSNLLLR